MQALARPLQASSLLQASRLAWAQASTSRAAAATYSTQYEESVHHPNPSKSQKVESPPITPDSSTGKADHVSDGRSSQTTSAYVAEQPMKRLVHKVRTAWLHGMSFELGLAELLAVACLMVLHSGTLPPACNMKQCVGSGQATQRL